VREVRHLTTPPQILISEAVVEFVTMMALGRLPTGVRPLAYLDGAGPLDAATWETQVAAARRRIARRDPADETPTDRGPSDDRSR